jgi:hypothetical protein
VSKAGWRLVSIGFRRKVAGGDELLANDREPLTASRRVGESLNLASFTSWNTGEPDSPRWNTLPVVPRGLYRETTIEHLLDPILVTAWTFVFV